jgi:putative MATE family efflux protein
MNSPNPVVWRRVLALAWPALLQNWLILSVSLSDRLLAGRFQELDPLVHTATQAAQTTASYLAWFLSSYTTLVSIGSTALIAHLYGSQEQEEACHVLHQSLLLALVLGLVGGAVVLLFLQPILGLLGLQGEAAFYAGEYLRPLLWQLPLQMVGAACVACLAGAGDTRTGLVVLGGVALLNLPLAWLFFHGGFGIPPLGFVGIAVGTAVAQSIGSLGALAILFRSQAGLRLRLAEFVPCPARIYRLLRISVPAALDSLSMQLGYLWFLRIINQQGDTASAAHGVALTWEALGYQSGAAFGTAALSCVGFYLGAGQPKLAARAGWVSLVWGTGIMSLMGVIFFVLAVPMFQLFCPKPEQEAIITMGVPGLRLIAFGMPALAACMIVAKALQGAGDSRWPMLATWTGFFAVRIPLAMLLTHWGFGLVGTWLAMLADLHLRGTLLLLRYIGGRWKLIRV